MTPTEAAKWYATLSEENRLQFFMEHYQLKQKLCAQTLLVSHWVRRLDCAGRLERGTPSGMRASIPTNHERILGTGGGRPMED